MVSSIVTSSDVLFLIMNEMKMKSDELDMQLHERGGCGIGL